MRHLKGHGWGLGLAMACLALGSIVCMSVSAQNMPPASATPPAPSSAPAAPDFTLYNTLDEATASAPNRLLLISHDEGIVFALQPFNSHTKSVTKAVNQLKAHGLNSGLLISDFTRLFSANAPPPGAFMGGDYLVIAISSVSFVDPTPERLVAEIGTHLFTTASMNNAVVARHVLDLIHKADAPEFAAAGPALADFLRDPRAVGLSPTIAQALVNDFAAHPPADVDATLLRWAQYHKHPTVRLQAMRVLVQHGHRDEVATLLSQEPNQEVKDAIGQLML